MHKYLSDNSIDLKSLPENYCSQDDGRQEFWKSQREEFGFDERETWNLNDSFFVWFFERLSMYNEVNNVATNNDEERIILSDDETITFQQAIDELLDITKYIIKFNDSGYSDDWRERTKEYNKKYERFMFLFEKTLPKLWW